MAKGTNRKKLAPIITLTPGATITPKSGTVLDFSKNIEWTLTTPEGSTVKYYLGSVFVTGDKDEANMVAIKLKCKGSGAVDPNFVSFALPGIFIASTYEYLPYPGYVGNPGIWDLPFWSTILGMAKGTDCTKLAPIITLAPGAKITWIHQHTGVGENFVSKKVDYTGIAKIGVYDFTKKVYLEIITPNGSTVTYHFIAQAFGDELP